MFQKILIANRGEIALRIIRACKEMGIQTLAVYSTADRDSMHVKMADEAICIGNAASADSYLKIPSIISAAEIGDVEAIHPGYGFLAENAHFAEVCESCNIKFIGPSPESIRMMGDKAQAKSLAKKMNVPIVPGSDGIVHDRETALKIAKKLGYPVLVKASAGGGGRGMRVAHNDISLANAFLTAKTEAETSFNNGDVYIEKYVEQPRHIEFQILADTRGNTIHLGERDCTIQRRHQKLIEETPSPILNDRLRTRMGKSAVKLAQAAKYVGAGTVEFLVDKDLNYYFLEMNTRIQVEHPITEQVLNIDLVKEQIKIAAGKKLRIEQKDIKPKGVAIECRINAEDPDKGFIPSAGKVIKFHPPGGPGVRVDSHIYSGYSIPPFYDSMVAKVITTAENRNAAIQKMICALGELEVEGIKTTAAFQIKILSDPIFQGGKNYSTHYIEQMLEGGKR